MTAAEPLPDAPSGDGTVFDMVLESIAEGVLVTDGERRIRLANAIARQLLDLGDDPVGARLEDAVDYRLALAVRACLEQGHAVSRELDGGAGDRLLAVRAIPLPSDGRASPAGAVVVVRDDSRLRHLETVRRDFVANVSHELRTPVTAIQLLVETLQKGALDDPPSAAQFVTRIAAEVSHMTQMVAELLELSAIESGARPMQFAPVSAGELLAAVDRLRPLAEGRRLQMQLSVEAGTPPILGDAPRLGQVLRNLVHNAIKFTPAGGSVCVTIGSAATAGDKVEIRVSDTGCGLTAEEAGRIFERFYKVDRSRQRDGEGTGLGLAIVRHVVEAHGGHVRVDSEPGRGSTFTVTLPAAPQPARAETGS